ncbi:hypothetical protein [uncultured Psychrobacter sp.]|jgi:arsenate reductase-like glutaredoxin family protein|uniref:hypothetical protein n=2 Tax=Psychrobacter TaxID=497 RepID=UPI002624AE3B|nr:hypothetical protein [uncultured Psychrobacter sp.]
MMSTLHKLISNLELQMNNIMSDNPSKDELKAINEQTRQLTAVSKQVVDIYRLSLDAGKFAHQTGADVIVSAEMLSVGKSSKALQSSNGDRNE